MEKNEIKVKTAMDMNTAKAVLDDLAKSFKEGTICIESGSEFVTLKPSDQISLEIKAAQKKGKEKLSVELSWRQAAVSDEVGEEVFKISGKAPEPVAEDVADGEAA